MTLQCLAIIISIRKDRNELDYIDNNILFKLIKITGMLQLTISGDSMIPSLYEGDLVDVVAQNSYCVGDILVFKYGENRIVAHRLLKRSEKLYCKGDNSFLLEHVKISDVLGKITSVHRGGNVFKPLKFDEELINLSYVISKEFRLCGYNKKILSQKDMYVKYRSKLYVTEKKTNG